MKRRMPPHLFLAKDLVLSIFLWLGLVACQAAPTRSIRTFSFEALCGLPAERFDQMDEEQARQWLEEQYGSVQRSTDLGEGVVKLWAQEKNGTGPVWFLRDGHLFEILQSFKDGPTFGQVVSAFGSPESVSGSALLYETISYSIGLDYPKMGLTVYDDSKASWNDLTHNDRFEARMRDDYIVNLVHCYKPRSTMEEVIRNGFPSDPKSVETILKRRNPWAGFGAWVSLEP